MLAHKLNLISVLKYKCTVCKHYINITRFAEVEVSAKRKQALRVLPGTPCYMRVIDKNFPFTANVTLLSH
jgi:hypothetical protein